MWSKKSSLEMCFSAATAFYSTVFVSECQADHTPGLPTILKDDDEFIHVYTTKVPWEPIELEKHNRNYFAVMAWTAVMSVVACTVAIVCFCCLCWKFYPKYHSRRQSSNAALVPNPTSVRTLPDNLGVDRRRRSSSRTGDSHNTGITNFAFTRDLPTPLSHSSMEDVPPAYSTVISLSSPSDKPTSAYPRVSESKTIETPPPAYVTVAPFQ